MIGADARGGTVMGAERLVAAGSRVISSRAFVWTVIGAASGLRIVQYLSGRSLWLDEAYLALNIVDRPFSQLFGALYYAQGAPPGFMFLERLAVDLFGTSEAALRLVPLLAGIVSLPLFYLAAKKLLSRAGAGAALVLFAILLGPIEYSANLKQYSTDVCVALVLLIAALRVVDRVLTPRATVELALVGALAVWFSHPAVFVLAGVGATLLVAAALRRDRARVIRLIAAEAAWVVSFGGVYLLSVHSIHEVETLGVSFLPRPTSPSNIVTIGRSVEEFLRGGLYLRLPAVLGLVGAALIALGIFSLARRSLERLLLLVAPIAVTVVASSAGRYPWGGRFTLFLAPVVPLLVVEGGAFIIARGWPFARVVAAVLVVAVAVPSVAAAVRLLVHPQRIEEMAPEVRTLDARFQPGDSLYLNSSAQYALRYYGVVRRMGSRLPLLPAKGDGLALRRYGDRVGYALRPVYPRLVIGPNSPDPAAVPRRGRVWVLLSHFVDGDPSVFLARLDRRGQRLLTERRTGVVLALYRFEPAGSPG